MQLIIMVMVSMCVAGITTWLILFRNYSVALWDVRNASYKTPLIKTVILRYSDCRKLNINVNNVKVFVEKIVENSEIWGLRPDIWEKFARLMKYMTIMITIVTAFFVRDNGDALYICVTVGVLSFLAIHMCAKLTDIARLREILVTETVDYLENSGEVIGKVHKYKPTCSKLTGRAAAEFERMNRQYEKIQSGTSFALKN